MQGIIKAATAKMAREAAFQPRQVRVTWPYGGSGGVVLAIDTAGPLRGEPAPAPAPAAGRPCRSPPPVRRPPCEAPGPADTRAAAQDIIINPGAAGGLIEIPMDRSEQGVHTAEVWVRFSHYLAIYKHVLPS